MNVYCMPRIEFTNICSYFIGIGRIKWFDRYTSTLCFLCPNCHSQTTTYAGKNVSGDRESPSKSKEEYIKEKQNDAVDRNRPLVDAILSSDINFQEYGWVRQVATLIGKKPQKIKEWMLKYMPDFYEQCYHRTTK